MRVPLLVADELGVPLGDGVCVSVPSCVIEGVSVCVVLAVSGCEPLTDGVEDTACVRDELEDAVALELRVPLADIDCDAVPEPLPDGV